MACSAPAPAPAPAPAAAFRRQPPHPTSRPPGASLRRAFHRHEQPFEEDAKDASIFFLDHDYLETMLAMFRKVAARERVVGFYSTGPRIRPCDLAIDALMRKYCADPVFVVVDVRRDVEGLPTQAYVSVDTVVEGRETVRTFNHVPCEVGAFEAEEVGVEHMLRDINDPSVSALGADVRAKLGGLKGLMSRLGEISGYLAKVAAGQLPPNLEALYLVQQASGPRRAAPRRAASRPLLPAACQSARTRAFALTSAAALPPLVPAPPLSLLLLPLPLTRRRCLRSFRTCRRSRCARASSRS